MILLTLSLKASTEDAWPSCKLYGEQNADHFNTNKLFEAQSIDKSTSFDAEQHRSSDSDQQLLRSGHQYAIITLEYFFIRKIAWTVAYEMVD